MIGRYLLIFIAFVAVLSCNREKQDGIYIVNAGKMIDMAGNNWSNFKAQMHLKTGYEYTASLPSTGIKAEVHLPAVDDSNRVVSGTILLNIANDNRIQFTMFNTDPLPQSVAYAMMLNYNDGSLQSITGITFSIGELIENGAGGNPPVSTVLSKLINGQIADQLAITYNCAQGRFTMVIFKQSDGRFIFSYRGTK